MAVITEIWPIINSVCQLYQGDVIIVERSTRYMCACLLCMSVCVLICVYVCVYVCVRLCLCSLCVSVSVCVRVHMYVHACALISEGSYNLF